MAKNQNIGIGTEIMYVYILREKNYSIIDHRIYLLLVNKLFYLYSLLNSS